MFDETEAYRTARKTNSRDIFFLFLQSSQTRRVFGKEYIDEELSGGIGEHFWDGTYYIGDGNIWSPLPVSDSRDLINTLGSIKQTIAPQSRDLLTSFAQTEIPSFSFEMDNAKGDFTDLLSLENRENFIFQNCTLYHAYPGLTFQDAQKIFEGEVISTPFNNRRFKVLAQSVSEGLRKILVLPKAGRYANPGNESDVLPYVVGEMSENSSAGACWKCPLIDSVNDVYAIACSAIQTAANGNTFAVYDNDGLISASEYSVTESGDYEGQGTISYLTFSTPPNGDVFITCNGRINSSGTLITNPITVIEDLLDYAGDTIDGFSYSPNDTAFSVAANDADNNSYTCAGVIISDNEVVYHLTHILSSFLGDWWVDNSGKLSVRLDVERTTYNIVADLYERNTITAINVVPHANNFVNQIQANYALTLKKSDLRYKNNTQSGYYMVDDGENTKDTQSQADLYIGQRKREFNFDWTRNTATVNAIQERLVERFKDGAYVISWQEKDLYNINVEVGDIVTFSTETLKDENGLTLMNQVGKVTSKEIGMDNYALAFEILDLEIYRVEPPELWDGSALIGDGKTWSGERDRRVLA